MSKIELVRCIFAVIMLLLGLAECICVVIIAISGYAIYKIDRSMHKRGNEIK